MYYHNLSRVIQILQNVYCIQIKNDLVIPAETALYVKKTCPLSTLKTAVFGDASGNVSEGEPGAYWHAWKWNI